MLASTSGSREEDGTTAWRFRGDHSFPSGYLMSARSFEIDRAAQQRILGRVAIKDFDQATELVRLAERSTDVRDRLRKARATGDRRWLESDPPGGIPVPWDVQALRRLLSPPG
jgi:hypothetical protein